MEKVEWDDVQGLVLSGYPKLPFSAFVLWRLRPQQLNEARQWLRGLTGRLMRAGATDGDDATMPSTIPISLKALKHGAPLDLQAINLALTARGLQQLEIGKEALENFSVEFLEGMAPQPDAAGDIPRRCNVLGDLGESSPARWDWGGWAGNSEIDGVLMLFAPDAASLQGLLERELQAMAAAAEPLGVTSQGHDGPPVLPGRIYDDRKEHFGYTDGISQPIIEGSPLASNGKHSDDDKRVHFVKPGEFVLGYVNERRTRAMGSAHDLRRNGSYLVLRQLEQDVEGFHDFVARAAERVDGHADIEDKKEWVAARLVGRTRSGRPLTSAAARYQDNKPEEKKGRFKPDVEQGFARAPKHMEEHAPVGNDFLYYFEDRFGLQCPVGAHIRRANPRDSKGGDPDTALRLSKMHRIIRRSRMYGERFDPATYEAGAANGGGGENGQHGERGILFVCLNADIAGQYEMIQHSWLNDRHFTNLYVGTDPIGHCPVDGGAVVIQRRPTNLVLERPKPFVRVRGGAYFFLPGISAVRALAEAR
jgi:Dyp-type peroxidase family